MRFRKFLHVDAFADLTPIDESTLIEKSQLLDAIADNDDIEWKTDLPLLMNEVWVPVSNRVVVEYSMIGCYRRCHSTCDMWCLRSNHTVC